MFRNYSKNPTPDNVALFKISRAKALAQFMRVKGGAGEISFPRYTLPLLPPVYGLSFVVSKIKDPTNQFSAILDTIKNLITNPYSVAEVFANRYFSYPS